MICVYIYIYMSEPSFSDLPGVISFRTGGGDSSVRVCSRSSAAAGDQLAGWGSRARRRQRQQRQRRLNEWNEWRRDGYAQSPCNQYARARGCAFVAVQILAAPVDVAARDATSKSS